MTFLVLNTLNKKLGKKLQHIKKFKLNFDLLKHYFKNIQKFMWTKWETNLRYNGGNFNQAEFFVFPGMHT